MTDISRLAEKIAHKLADAHSELFDKYETPVSADMFDEMYQRDMKQLSSLLHEVMNQTSAGMQTTVTDMMNKRIDKIEAQRDYYQGKIYKSAVVRNAIKEAYTRAAEVAREHGRIMNKLACQHLSAAIEKLREDK